MARLSPRLKILVALLIPVVVTSLFALLDRLDPATKERLGWRMEVVYALICVVAGAALGACAFPGTSKKFLKRVGGFVVGAYRLGEIGSLSRVPERIDQIERDIRTLYEKLGTTRRELDVLRNTQTLLRRCLQGIEADTDDPAKQRTHLEKVYQTVCAMVANQRLNAISDGDLALVIDRLFDVVTPSEQLTDAEKVVRRIREEAWKLPER